MYRQKLISLLMILICISLSSCASFRLTRKQADKIWNISNTIQTPSAFEHDLSQITNKYKKIQMGQPSRKHYSASVISKMGYASESGLDQDELVGAARDFYWSQIEAIFGKAFDRERPDKYLVYIIPERISANVIADQEGHFLVVYESGQCMVAKEICVLRYGWYNTIRQDSNTLFFPYHVWVLGNRRNIVHSDEFYRENPNNMPVRESKVWEVIGGSGAPR